MCISSVRDEALVRFYRMIAEARPPQRADRSAAGTLPVRAVRYCHAITAAAAFGWYVFPPMDFSLLWDGADIFWNQTEGTLGGPTSVADAPAFARSQSGMRRLRKKQARFVTACQKMSKLFADTYAPCSRLMGRPEQRALHASRNPGL